MNTKLVAALVLGMAATTAGCGAFGGDCKFAKGEISADINPQAKAFMAQVMEGKKLQMDWQAAIAAMATDLKTEPNEKAVLAKIQENFSNFRAKGECTFSFSADVDLKASFEAAATGKAGTGGSSGSASASGDASVTVNVKVEPKCKAEVPAEVLATVKTLQTNLPKLFAAAKGSIIWLAKIPELKTKGEAALKAAATDFKLLPEIKCAIETLTGFQANLSAQVDFSVSVSGSVKGEAK